MKAIILAAGRGSRLKKLTEDKPKCLNIVGGLTILEREINALKSGGADGVFIITGYKKEALQNFGYKTIYNYNWESTNMVKSLLCAQDLFGETVIVSYSDILYSSKTVKELIAQPNDRDIVISYDPNWKRLWEMRFSNPSSDAESFKINEAGVIHEIGKKGVDTDEIQGQYMGLMRFSPKAFEWIDDFVKSLPKDEANKLDITALLKNLINNGRQVYGVPVKDAWCEIDSEGDLEIANALI